ncbi:hypothetical protein OWC48_43875 [Bradyrhizobium sp. Arg816]|nr:hypothetical protein [Bradyrhizobium sp. Arg816]
MNRREISQPAPAWTAPARSIENIVTGWSRPDQAVYVKLRAAGSSHDATPMTANGIDMRDLAGIDSSKGDVKKNNPVDEAE